VVSERIIFRGGSEDIVEMVVRFVAHDTLVPFRGRLSSTTCMGKWVATNSSRGDAAPGSHFAARVCSTRWMDCSLAAAERADHSARSASRMYPEITPVIPTALIATEVTTSSRQKPEVRWHFVRFSFGITRAFNKDIIRVGNSSDAMDQDGVKQAQFRTLHLSLGFNLFPMCLM